MSSFPLLRGIGIFAFVALLAAGCVSTELTSTKASDYDEQIEHLYLVTRLSPEIDEVETAVFSKFTLHFENQSVPIDTLAASVPDTIQAASELQLDDSTSSVPFRAAKDTGASNVLVIQELSRETWTEMSAADPDPADSQMGPSGGFVRSGETYVFEASLYDVESKKRVWRGELDMTGDLEKAGTRTGEDLAKHIMEDWKKKVLLPTDFMVMKY